MGKHFLVKATICVSVVLITRCLIAGNAVNRTHFEQSSPTKSTSHSHPAQVKTKPEKIQESIPATVNYVFT